MNKIYAVVVLCICIFSFAFKAEAQNRPSSDSTNNRNTAPKERAFAKSNTKMNVKDVEEVPDNGFVRSFVTGTKTPLDMGRLGAGISVITSETITEMNPFSVADILRIVPGIIIVEKGTNYITASIQGAPAGETNVMVDGISLNSPADRDRGVDLSSININMNSIERIEIIRNPTSIGNYYGATGGIINIITKNGEEQAYTVSLYGDMLFNLENKLNGYRTGINFAGSKPTLQYSLSFNRLEEVGISQAAEWYNNSEKDGRGSNNALARFALLPIEGLKTGIYVNYTDFYKEFDNHGGIGGDNSAYKLKEENVLFGWDIAYKVEDVWQPSLKLTYKYMNKKYTNKKSNDILFGNGIYNGQQVVLDFNNTFYVVEQLKLSVGAEYVYDSADIRENNIVAKDRLNKTVDGINTYAQATIDLFDAWTTVISAKGDFYGEYSQYGYLPTYGISTAYNIEEAGLTLKASFGTGAMTPTIYQRYDSQFGNVNLKPEESMSYQAGFSNNIMDGLVIWGGSWFENYYKNMITKDLGGVYQNTGKAHSYGVEGSLRINPADFVSIFGSYTWLNAFTLENGKKKIDRMPEHSMAGGVIFKMDKIFSLNVNVNYMSDRLDMSDNPLSGSQRVKLEQYYLLNAALSINVTKNFEIYITGTNLLDTRYEFSDGYGTRGLEMAVGLRIKM